MSYGCAIIATPIATAYETLGEAGLQHALNEPECVAMFTNAELLKVVANVASNVPSLRVVIYDGDADTALVEKIRTAREGMRVLHIDELRKLGKEASVEALEARRPNPEDTACIMYTSGTTGAPKGVVISHANVIASVGGVYKYIGHHLKPDDSYLAYLPLLHGVMDTARRDWLGDARVHVGAWARREAQDRVEIVSRGSLCVVVVLLERVCVLRVLQERVCALLVPRGASVYWQRRRYTQDAAGARKLPQAYANHRRGILPTAQHCRRVCRPDSRQSRLRICPQCCLVLRTLRPSLPSTVRPHPPSRSSPGEPNSASNASHSRRQTVSGLCRRARLLLFPRHKVCASTRSVRFYRMPLTLIGAASAHVRPFAGSRSWLLAPNTGADSEDAHPRVRHLWRALLVTGDLPEARDGRRGPAATNHTNTEPHENGHVGTKEM